MMLGALGIPDDAWTATTQDDSDATVATLVNVLVAHRARARDAGEFVAAERIRDEWAAAGIVLDDTAAGM